MKYRYVLLFSPLFFFQNTLLTPAYRPTKSTPFSFVTPSSILSHKIGKGSDLLFPFSYPWPTLGCCCTRLVKSTQYLKRKHLVVNSERMAEQSTGQSRILPYMRIPFLLGWRIAERETVSRDWGWRLGGMGVPVGGEIFGERHALCPFERGKYHTSLPSFFDLPVFNFHSLWPLPSPPLVIDGGFN